MSTPIQLVQGDITTLAVDVVVNAANNSLLGGGGVDGAIHGAGGAAILEECHQLRRTSLKGGLPTGSAVATTAGRLPARWVIHTVGPIYSADEDRAALLRSCYRESLRVADELGASSIAFPLVSAGVYGWPREDAVRQALAGISESNTDIADIRLVLFDDETLRIAEQVHGS